MPASLGRLVLVLMLAVLAGSAGNGAGAASIDTTYDMTRMLAEPHPLSGQMGTRWQPAPVDPRALAPRPSAQPVGPLPVIQPAILLPMPAGQPAAGDGSGLQPRLELDDAGTVKPGSGSEATPAARGRAVAEAAPWVSPDGPLATRQSPPARVVQAQSPAQAQVQAQAPAPAPASKSTARAGAQAPVRGQPDGGIFSEIRFGALAHDTGPFSHKKEEGVDANVELLFTSPSFLKVLWSPRPHIGGNINSKGDTSQVYFGLSWEWDFWRHMFGGFSLGGAWHDGETTNAPLDRKELGCSVLFRESVELGFRIGERHSLSAFLDHISNAKLCSTNEGLENVGMRYGYKF